MDLCRVFINSVYKLFENGKTVQNLVPTVAPICGTCNGFEHRFGSKMLPLYGTYFCVNIFLILFEWGQSSHGHDA